MSRLKVLNKRFWVFHSAAWEPTGIHRETHGDLKVQAEDKMVWIKKAIGGSCCGSRSAHLGVRQRLEGRGFLERWQPGRSYLDKAASNVRREDNIVNDVTSKVVEILSEATGVSIEEIDNSKHFGDMGMDSLEIVEAVMEMEDEFQVDIPDEIAFDETGESTVDKLVELILNEFAKQGGGL